MKKKITYGIIIFIVIGIILAKYVYEAQSSSYIFKYDEISNIYAIMNKQDSKIEFIANGYQKVFNDNDKEQLLKTFKAIKWVESDLIEFGQIPAERIRVNDMYWLAFYDDKIEIQPSKKVFKATEKELKTLESIIKIYRNDMFILGEELPLEFFENYFKEVTVSIEVDSEKYGYKKISIEQSNEFRKLINYDEWEQIYTYEKDIVNVVNMLEKGTENISSITILEDYLVHIGRTDSYFKIPQEQYDKILLFVEKIYS
ncbi:MAG: hypothetical protein N4A50_04625 [Vallitalea sp.]|jgi:hypothetical protein|nr:hypothetical protein [Vallitalea sp.]